jgi:hypothetical protein
MQKAERVGRLVGLTLLGSLALALAGCGGDSGSGAASATSTSSTTPTAVTDPAPTTGTSGSSGSGSSTTTPTPVPMSSSSSVTLGWVAPTENSDGTPISNLAGYKIHYGTTSQDYTQVVSVSNPSLSRYVLDSLPSGTYYFAITAYNAKGIESTLSGEISTTLN